MNPIDQIISEVKKNYLESGQHIRTFENSCSKGCSFCCHQSVRIVGVEEFNITAYIRDHVKHDIKKIIKINLKRWFDYFNQSTRKADVSSPLSDDEIREFELKMARDKIACPFLINNVCSIYPARPLVCRTHIVKENPSECDNDRLRDPIPEAKYFAHEQLNKLTQLGPFAMFRLLPYAVAEFFSLHKEIKPVEVLLFPNRFRKKIER
jgi:Fe-S-cluster containining protein